MLNAVGVPIKSLIYVDEDHGRTLLAGRITIRRWTLSREDWAMPLLLATTNGVWALNGKPEQIGLANRKTVHVADQGGTILAAVPKDGLYTTGADTEQRVWDGDARASAVGPDGSFYIGTEPAMVFRSDDRGASWTRCSRIDQLPTRSKWYFPPPPHEPHVRSIDFLPETPGACWSASRWAACYCRAIVARAGRR
jgi:hypothetical protein